MNLGSKKSLRFKVLNVERIDPQQLQIEAQELNQSDCDKKGTSVGATNKTVNGDAQVSYDDSTWIMLEGVWAQGHIVPNSLIHLIDPLSDGHNSYLINNTTGFVVIEPDTLLTCTSVASTLFCERKTWLNHVFLGQAGTNRAMLVGTLVHEVFQYGVRNRTAEMEKLIAHLDGLLDDATVMLEIYSVELHLNDIRAEALSYLKSVKEWIEKYMFAGPRYALTNDADQEVKVIGVNDIEENIWSTKYGLKGKIDVTGSVRVYDRRAKTLKDKTLPLELKTGNPNLSASHAAQVSLYSMMIEDRYAETNQGLVIYLKDKAAMHNVSLTHNIKRDLIQRRNQINHHMKSYFFGPEMIDQPRMCKNCERLTECVLMSKLYTPGDIENYPSMRSLELEATGHLDDKFQNFFRHYHEKISKSMTKTQTPIASDKGIETKTVESFWTISSDEAENRGIGFGKLQIVDYQPGRNLVTFKRHPDHKDNYVSRDKVASPKRTVKKQRIEDYFKPKVADLPKTKSFDVNLDFSRCRIAVSFDDDKCNLDKQNSSTAIVIGFMQDLKHDSLTLKLYEGTLENYKPCQMYRVDKIAKRANLDIERLVLVRLLARNDWRCDRVRDLILEPKYKPSENIDLNLFVLSAGFEEITELDADYQKCVVEAVSTDNYFIFNERNIPKRNHINKVIASLTRIVCSLDRTVLIVAPNIDHLVDLMKILQRKTKFILIDDGKSTKARFMYASNLVRVPQSENLDLVKKYDSYIRQHELAPVVLTSYAMSIGGLLFTRRTFDYCIAYDCDTTELLVSLSPMFCSDRHVIIDVREPAASPTVAKEPNNTCPDVNVTLGTHLRELRDQV